MVQHLLSTQLRIQELFKKNESAVVQVKATREEVVDGKTKRLLKMGSGFFVSKDGHILTTGLLPNASRVWVEHKKAYYLKFFSGGRLVIKSFDWFLPPFQTNCYKQ